ncbi:replication initiation protein (plasmid) [Psychrobacillus glaciei]|uniref:Replication initiation protein n=1 Tax=Psychrobacillus glaciei TaxID=2283160 RepID=A0A5J6ST87_9BACI|nr:replication initiation protein [Psychrobacillus glaciei]QFG01292.1 replication initiation protein [Psychrobacillus glaciei]
MRKNTKKIMISNESSIKKSNELSMAKLNAGLTLNQVQLLAFAIYTTQQKNVTTFQRRDFLKRFELVQYTTTEINDDVEVIFNLHFSTLDLEKDKFTYQHIFQSISYDKGTFEFKWADSVLPHILSLKNNYVVTDLNITSQFKSSFSWALYEYLKAHYGYWHKEVSKEALLRLFGVDKKKSYVGNTALFKKYVLDVAIKEIVKFTEIEVSYKEIKKGRSITGFDLIWSIGELTGSATRKQIDELERILTIISDDALEFMDLKEDENRKRASELIRESAKLKIHTEKPVSITIERADFLIKKANEYLKELQYLKENAEADKVPFYNWLEERE